jgi:hypothetical protein
MNDKNDVAFRIIDGIVTAFFPDTNSKVLDDVITYQSEAGFQIMDSELIDSQSMASYNQYEPLLNELTEKGFRITVLSQSYSFRGRPEWL